jgi:hypothetical protein
VRYSQLLPMLGVQPFLGRLFIPEEDRPGGNTVAVLSYGCWKEKFGGDPAAIGKTIRQTANLAEFTIVGVLPDFEFATVNFHSCHEDVNRAGWLLIYAIHGPSLQFHGSASTQCINDVLHGAGRIRANARLTSPRTRDE